MTSLAAPYPYYSANKAVIANTSLTVTDQDWLPLQRLGLRLVVGLR